MMNVKNFYLNMLLNQYEYMHMNLDIIPNKIIDAYGLRELATHDWVYIDTQKGIYGLSQVGLLTKNWMYKRLEKKGY